MASTMAHQTTTESPPAPRERSLPRIMPGARPHGLAPAELIKLHHTLAQRLPTGQGIVAQLVAPEHDRSITQVAYDLAYISASWLDKRVLYVNGTDMRMDVDEPLVTRREEPRLGSQFDPDEWEGRITRVVGLDLYQMTFPSMGGALDLAPVLRRIPEFMDQLRQTFDLVIIAAPAASVAPMGVLLAPYVDGSVLVLESGRTRGPIAAALRDSLRSSGGSVIGVVMTSCRSFAPRWLRRWL
jgi:hypothetical protein